MSVDDNGEALAPLDAMLRWVATPEERAAIEAWRDPTLTPLTIQSFANWKHEGMIDGFEREYPHEDEQTYRPPTSVLPIYEQAKVALTDVCARLTALLATGGTGEWLFTAKAIPNELGAEVQTLPVTWFRDFNVHSLLLLPDGYGKQYGRDRKNEREWRWAVTQLNEFIKKPRIVTPWLGRPGFQRFSDHFRPESLVICRNKANAQAGAKRGRKSTLTSYVMEQGIKHLTEEGTPATPVHSKAFREVVIKAHEKENGPDHIPAASTLDDHVKAIIVEHAKRLGSGNPEK